MADQDEKRIIVKVAYNYFQSGKWDRALEEYKKLVAIDPMDFLVHNMMGEIYARKGEIKMAVDEYINAANLLRATNNMERALHAYNHVLRLEPANTDVKAKIEEIVRARLVEADEMIRRGSLKNALAICERVAEKAQDHPLVAAKLAEIEQLMQDRQDKVLPSQEAPAQAPRDEAENPEETVKNLFAMAEDYEAKQSWDEAVETYITILRFVPGNENARQKLRDIYRRIARPGEPAPDPALSAPLREPEPPKEDPITSGGGAPDMERLRLQAEEKLRRAVEDRRERERLKNETATAGKPAEANAISEAQEEDIRVLLTQTQMYVHQNLLVEAMRLCQRILEIDPQNKDVRGLLKQIYDKKNF